MRTNGHGSRGRRAIVALALAAGLSSGFTAAAEAQQTTYVTVDQAFVIQLDNPATAVIIGNPSIADATIMDASTLVITGRSFGTTNLIVLGGDGMVIREDLITVQNTSNLVTVYRRDTQQSYSCTPVCAPTLNVGDAPGIFERTTDQIQARQALALGGG